VRVPVEAGADITPFAGHTAEFQRTIRHHPPELIEVKRKLNRSAIGQIIAGHGLFTQQYEVCPGRLVIVCAVGDGALAWVCHKRDIVVRIIDRPDHRDDGRDTGAEMPH
jgi:hypothetical protein